MRRQKIVICYDEIDESERVVYKNSATYYGKITDASPVLTIEQLVEFCDHNSEGRNNHEYVGAHETLGNLLVKEIGREKATHIMAEIAAYGGLDGMNGVGH